MPVTCPIDFPRLTTEDFRALDYEVMAHAFASHREMGRLGDENVYSGDLAARLETAGFSACREVEIELTFRGFVKVYYLDLVVNRCAIYELKTVAKIIASHESQLLNYLLSVNASRGKLLNFRPDSLESRYVNAPLTVEQRRSFQVEDRGWRGDNTIHQWIIDMLRDWGVGLELPLYHDCIVHYLGGYEQVTKQLPMRRDGIFLGSQRFHLINPSEAFRVTAIHEHFDRYEHQLKQLLTYSPLSAIHCVNLVLGKVTFSSIGRDQL